MLPGGRAGRTGNRHPPDGRFRLTSELTVNAAGVERDNRPAEGKDNRWISGLLCRLNMRTSLLHFSEQTGLLLRTLIWNAFLTSLHTD